MEFKEDICIVESEFEYSYRGSYVENNSACELTALELFEKNTSQVYEWSERGKSNIMEIYKDSFNFSYILNEKEALQSLIINGDYLQESESQKLKKTLAFPLVDEQSIFNRVELNNWFYLSGDYITDDFFNKLLLNPSINNVRELRITKTAMTEASFLKISSLKKLELINFEDMDITFPVLEQIKKQLPDCKITINREEIVFNSEKE